MVTVRVDNVSFQLKEAHDFSWLHSLGRVFCVFAQNDSGNISFGVDDGKKKYFVKAAGLKTAAAVRTPQEAVASLKAAMPVYHDLQHPHVIRLVRHYAVDDLYIAVFDWAEGDCLFDHWNFEKYARNPQTVPPARRFKQLPAAKRLQSVQVLFSFLETVSQSGYVAVDFYDGSILYDFATDTTTICDIDFFRRKPAVNDMGADYFGTKRLKAPEEYQYGAVIDETTMVFTLGALLFDFFGSFRDEDIRERYEKNAFKPCPAERWELSRLCYEAALKAVMPERDRRYGSIVAFRTAWQKALRVE